MQKTGTVSPNNNAGARVVFCDAATAPAAAKEKPKLAVGNGGRIVDHYALQSQLHTSMSTGTEVHAARHRTTGELVCMKAIDRPQLAAAGRVPVAHTTALHAQLEHENIVRLHEVFDSQRVVHVLEWVNGITVEEFMSNHGCGPVEAQQIMQQLVAGVAHMHSVGVCHRDLRLRNVMLRAGARCCVKIIDLGSIGPAGKLLSRRVPVVPVYAAPELLPKGGGGRNGASTPAVEEYSGKAVDVWALGIILHVMLTGTFPFTSEAAVREGKLRPHAALPDSVLELLRGMLAVDRAARLSAADVLAHEWLRPTPKPAAAVIASGSPAAWLRAKAVAAAAGESEPAADHEAAAAHEQVLAELETLGFATQAVVEALEAGARDELTTAYCLLWQKRVRAATASNDMQDVGDGDEADAADGDEPVAADGVEAVAAADGVEAGPTHNTADIGDGAEAAGEGEAGTTDQAAAPGKDDVTAEPPAEHAVEAEEAQAA